MLQMNVRDSGKDEFLTFIISSKEKSFELRDFEGDNIQVKSLGLSWYFDDVSNSLKQLSEVINIDKRKRFVFIGCSKGGYGAILFAALLSKIHPDCYFGVVGFSPITYFHVGENFPACISPSFRSILGDKKHRGSISKCGDLNKHLRGLGNNIKILSLYSYHETWFHDVRWAMHIANNKCVELEVIPPEEILANSWDFHRPCYGDTVARIHNTIAYIYKKKTKQFYETIFFISRPK